MRITFYLGTLVREGLQSLLNIDKEEDYIPAIYPVPKKGKVTENQMKSKFRSFSAKHEELNRLVLDLIHQTESALSKVSTQEKFADMPILSIFHSCGQSLPSNVNSTDDQVEKHKHTLKGWIGFSEFDRFVEDTEWESMEPSMGPQSCLNWREQLLLSLIILRQGFSFSQAARMCSLNPTTVGRYYARVMEKLLPWAQRTVCFFNIKPLLSMHSEEFKREYPHTIMLFVDGTPLPCLQCQCPPAARSRYNVKHAMPAKCFTILVTETRKILWVSPAVPGKESDREAWNQSNIAIELAKAYPDPVVTEPDGREYDVQMAIGADKGYPGIRIPTGWTLHLTKSAVRTDWKDTHVALPREIAHLTYVPKKEEIVMDPKLAKYRSRVEMTIADLKDNRLLVCPEYVHFHLESLNNSIECACAINNWKIDNLR